MATEHAPVSLGSGRDVMAQGEEPEALRRERDLLSAVLDTAGALVVLLDREGRIVRFNRACETTTGYSSEAARGHALWDLLLVPEEVEPVRAVLEQLWAGQFPNEYENHWLTRDGDRRLIAWSNTVLVDANGEVGYVIGTGIDITERRQAEAQRDGMLQELRQARDELELRVAARTAELQMANRVLEAAIAERSRAEEALRESEGHLRSLMESAQKYAVYRITSDPNDPYLARLVLASPSLADLLGVSDLYDLATWVANIHPDDLERVVEANRRSLETGAPFGEQYRVFKKTRGEWDWVDDRSTPVFDAEGRLTHFNGLVVDVTQQKRAEEEIRRQNEFLAALHETALGIFSRLNVDELLEAMMERALHLVGATYGFVYMVRHGEDEVEVRVGTGPYRAYVGRRMKRGEGLAGRIYQSGQPLAVENYQSWPDRSPQFEGVPFGPAIGVPLMSGTEVVGVLGLARSTAEAPFRQDEMDLIGRLSHLASIALDNARLHTSVQEELAERTRAERTLQATVELEDAVARISGSFINLMPEQVDEGIQRALKTIADVYHMERTYVFQFSGDRAHLECTHEWCAEGIEPQIHRLKDIPAEYFRWTVEKILRSELVQIRDESELPPDARAERAEFQELGLRSRLAVPMVYRGAAVGFVGFDARQARQWTEQSLKLQVIGDIFVNALEHRRAQAVQAGQRHFLELLATGGDFSEILHTLVRLIEDQWPGMLGLILLLDEDGRHLHIGASVSLPEDYVQSIEGLEIGPMVGSCGTACYRRERVIVEDTATDPRWDGLRDLALRYNLRACWSEPVFSPDGQVVGTFAMYYRQPGAPTEAELDAIEMGAHLVGVAIEHRRAEKALRESEEKFRGIVEYANVGIAIVQDARFRFVNPHYAAMLGYTAEEMLGTEFMPYCTPEERDRIVDLYTRRARGEPAPPRYETAMVHKNGRHVYAEVSAGLIPYGGQQATFVFLRDITEEKQAKQALEEAYQTLEQRVEDRTRELSTLLEASKNLASRLELEPLLGSILDELRSVVDYEGCTVYGLEGDELVARAHRGRTPQKGAMGWRWGVDDPLDRLVLRGREPVLVSDTRGDSAEAQAYRESVGELQETLYPHIRSWLGVPLIVKGQVIGELALDHSHPGFFTPAHASFAMAFANQAAVAIENARLYEAEQERTKELVALNMVSGVVSRSLDLNEILHSALDKTMEVTEMEMGAAYLPLVEGDPDDPSRRIVGYKLVANRGLSKELVEAIERIPLRNSAMDQAADMGWPYVWQIADVSPQAGLAQLFEKEGLGFAISVPLMAKGQIVGSMNVGTRQSRPLTPEALSLLAAIGQQVGMAVENARLYEAEQSRREEAERRRQVAEGMREILAVLNSRQALPEILDFIARQTCRLLDSDAAAILRLEEDELRIQAACGLDPYNIAGATMPFGLGSASPALTKRQPEIVVDLADAARRTARGSELSEPQKSLLEHLAVEFRAILSVPLIVQGQGYGVITIYYRNARDFSDEDLHLAMGVTNQAALAVESARLRQQAEQAAAIEERGRLARELHDSVTQSLYSVTMYTEAAARLLPAGHEAAAEHLRDARDTAKEALQEMRLLIYQLRPPVLEKGGLAFALQVRLDSVERRGGIQADLVVEGEDRLPPSIQAELHQIAQEALNNALKHAHARQVQVRLQFGDVSTCLEVRDDGVGFELPTAEAGGGLGLPGMKERAQRIGGRLKIVSAPGQGTQVVVEVPNGGGG